MARLHKAFKPLDDAKIRDLEQELRNLQGNILRGHGRDHATYIFLTFKRDEKGEVGEVKEWIRETADRVTSAYKQRRESEEKRQNNIPGDLFCNFFLSAAGYQFLYKYFVKLPSDTSFQTGLWKRWEELYKHVNSDTASSLSDDIYSDWEDRQDDHSGSKKYQNIHALLMLADDNKEVLDKECSRQIKQLSHRGIIDSYFCENGEIMRCSSSKEESNTYDHFGFRDNISQPLFFKQDVEKYKQTNPTDKWDPSAGTNLVLIEDPNVPKDKGDAHGSYLVFLKLEQDVDAFNGYSEDIKASLMGRYPYGEQDGKPLLSSKKEKRLGESLNNFDYFRELRDSSQESRQLQKPIPPFSSHIRRMNPRGEYAASQRERPTYERRHRIVRRGIPYAESSSKKGLLFMCYQADIGRQFEYLLQSAHRSDYVEAGYIKSNFDYTQEKPERDAIIGRLLEVSDENRQAGKDKQKPGSNGNDQDHTYPRFVTLRGGEFFFAPSIPFLRELS